MFCFEVMSSIKTILTMGIVTALSVQNRRCNTLQQKVLKRILNRFWWARGTNSIIIYPESVADAQEKLFDSLCMVSIKCTILCMLLHNGMGMPWHRSTTIKKTGSMSPRQCWTKQRGLKKRWLILKRNKPLRGSDHLKRPLVYFSVQFYNLFHSRYCCLS